MGKTPSPGKWFKSLLGKKSSKSNLPKGRDKLKSGKKEEVAVSVKDDVSDLPVVSTPAPAITVHTVVEPITVVADKEPSDETTISNVKDNEGEELNINQESQIDLGELKREEAAIKVQAAFRAHQGRKEFQTLKSVTRLQAAIRGHLVRRQAVATYSCIWGIVKLQALVRGQKARSSDTGTQLQKIHKSSDSANSKALQTKSYSWVENPAKLTIIDKLLASSPNVLPLKLRYGPEDPNSATLWLERWTSLKIWAASPRVTDGMILKPLEKKCDPRKVENEKGMFKRGIKKLSGLSTNNSSSRPSAENEKPKRSMKKPSTSSKQIPKSENDKAKQNPRKISSSKKEGSVLEVKALRKSAEKKKVRDDSVQKETVCDVAEEHVVESAEKEKDDANGVYDESVQICSENDNVANETTKASERRASLPAKIDHQDDDDGLTQSGRKIPSYMAPTASAKARVKGQSSPRFSQERIEKNGGVRRHSLPSSSANGKLNTMSPRAHRLLLASGKGSMNSDRSFASSKDAGDKWIRAEWKR